MKKTEWILLGVVVLGFAVGAWAYPQLPPTVTSHWDASGNPNGALPSFWGAFLFPIILAFIALIFFIIPRVDPKRDNIEKFRKYYDYFALSFIIIFFWIFLLFLEWNLGQRFDFSVALLPALCGLFWVVGGLLPHTKPNWTIGIRTPWTLSSEHVWKKTHQAGEMVFKIAAVIGLMGVLFPPYGLWLLVGLVLVGALGLLIYSYILFEEERK